MTTESTTFPDGFYDNIEWDLLPAREQYDCGTPEWDLEFEYRYDGGRTAQLVAALRDLISHLEKHPALGGRIALEMSRTWGPLLFDLNARNAEDLAEMRRAFGLADKFGTGYQYGFLRDFGPIRIRLSASRGEVCEQIETGETEEYTERELVAPAVYREVIKTRPKTEWKCPGSVLAKALEKEGAPDE